MAPSGASLGNTVARGILVAAACGCAGSPPPTSPSSVAYDLIDLLPTAQVAAEQVFIDVGTLRGRDHLGDGWSIDETDRWGHTFAWATGEASTLHFDRVAAGDLELRLRLRGPEFGGDTPRPVDVRVNGHDVGTWEAVADWSDVVFALPDGTLVDGANTLELVHPWYRSPASVTRASDDRPLAVRVDGVRVVPAGFVDAAVLVDIGAPDGRSHLVGGWSGDETDANGVTFSWSAAGSSDVAVRLDGGVASTLSFRARPFEWSGAPPQRVAVSCNGEPVGDVTLEPGWGGYEVALPAGVVEDGANLVRFTYTWTRRPSDVSASQDPRNIGVAWDWIRFDGAAAAKADGDRLVVPSGTRVSWVLDLPPGAALRVTPDAEAAAMAVILTDPATGATTRHLLAPGSEELALTAADGATTRLRLSLTPAGGAATAGLGHPRVTAGSVPAPPANVLVYVVDTLRADHLGVYGYDRPTSPRLDAFAADAVVFEDASAQASWTKSAVATLITGLSPREHGAEDREDVLAPSVRTLAEIMSDADYTTAAVVTNGNVSAPFGFDQGYAHFEYMREQEGGPVHRRAGDVTARVLEWLDVRPVDAPFFLYVHVTDPHAPYVPLPEFRARFAASVPEGEVGYHSWIQAMRSGAVPVDAQAIAWAKDLYDAEIAYTDQAFGSLLDGLVARGVYDDTLVVFTSDHGEEFHEHGSWEHGRTLYQEQLHVPLLVRPPGGRGERSAATAGQIDVAPTVLSVAHVTVPPEMSGRDLLVSLPGRRPAFASLHLDGRALDSVTSGDRKLIRMLAPTVRTEVYDLETDPGEQQDRAGEGDTGELDILLDAHIEATSSGFDAPEAVLDQELTQVLQALGYLDP